jgi:hypothetical protein
MHCSTATAAHKQWLVQAYPTAHASCAVLLLLSITAAFQYPAAVCQVHWPSCTAAATTLLPAQLQACLAASCCMPASLPHSSSTSCCCCCCCIQGYTSNLPISAPSRYLEVWAVELCRHQGICAHVLSPVSCKHSECNHPEALMHLHIDILVDVLLMYSANCGCKSVSYVVSIRVR